MCEGVSLVVVNEVHYCLEAKWLNKTVQSVAVVDLDQLIATSLPGNDKRTRLLTQSHKTHEKRSRCTFEPNINYAPLSKTKNLIFWHKNISLQQQM